jgi:5-methylcytosine-specific restriction endonuclease McrA
MNKLSLPLNYTSLAWRERRNAREQYIIEQDGNCMYCGDPLSDKPAPRIT